MFWICRNRKVVILKEKKKTPENCFKPWHKTYFESKRRRQDHQHKVTCLLRPNGAPRQGGQRGQGSGRKDRSPVTREGACSSLPCDPWDCLSVPCSSSHVPSLVEKWCLQWTCFLVLHLVKCFFLYFCWRLNICINCKYIWFITVKALVPISVFPFPSLFLLNLWDHWYGFYKQSLIYRGSLKMHILIYQSIW